MNRIKILSDNVKSKIAAGEVVSGPYSVVKELVENSIDANATEITVQVVDSGFKKILIKDNGDGILKNDIELAIQEHATSKIQDVYDIETIASYGFRGEALSSIASISKLSILTKSVQEKIGARLVSSEDGISINDYAGPAGTTIIIENLFYNTPARKKFLKAKKTELKYIREEIIKIAQANYKISFFFDVEDKRKITLPSVNSVEKRVEQIYGNDISNKLYFEKLQDLKVNIKGFFSKPDGLRSSRSMQFLYINGRPIDYKYLGFVLSRAYEAIAIRGQHPVAIIFIEIDPELIDVNIHPAKREIKFFDQKYIDRLIYSLAEKALNKEHNIKNETFKTALNISSSKIESNHAALNFNSENNTATVNYNFIDKNNKYIEKSDSTSVLKDVAELYKDINQDVNSKIVGVVFNTYVIVEDGDQLQFIDFHAAHERIIFDKLLAKKDSFEKQDLLFPQNMQLSIEDYSIIVENINKFLEIGFDIDDFADNTIIIRAIPEISGKIDVEDIIKELIESLKSEKDDFNIEEKIIATLACHSARRAGDNLSSNELQLLVNEISDGIHEMRCPHGRPFVYTIGKNDLERLFKR